MEIDELTKKTILTASQSWLALVDVGDFTEGLNRATENFRSRNTSEIFEAKSLMWNYTKSSGSTFTRNFKSIRRTASQFDWPQGDYILVEYETRQTGSDKRPYLEVTPMVNEKGEWRVWDYYYTFDEPLEAIKQAVLNASQRWLALLDAGNFVESWNQATKDIRPWVTLERFEALTRNFIAINGRPRSRSLKDIRYSDSLQFSPMGDYILVTYDTIMEFGEKPLVETASMIYEGGEWKVWTYYFVVTRESRPDLEEKPRPGATPIVNIKGEWVGDHYFLFNQLDEQTRQAILTVSQDWLALLDAGDFVECCNQAAPYLRSSITPNQFKAIRKRFIAIHGKVTSRAFKNINYPDEQPDLPKGECLLVVYETKLEFEENPILEVTPMVNEDGIWKVWGYHYNLIKPPYHTFPPEQTVNQEYRESTYGDRIADVYDHWYPNASPDAIVQLSELAAGGPVLELGIGTGRLALPLARRGIEVHGIDSSEAIVAKMASKPGGERIPVTIGNFADVGVNGEYALIFVAFNTFFCLSNQEEQVQCFANVAKRLRRGGLFLIDAFVPDPSRFTDDQILKISDIGIERVLLEASIHDRLSQRVMSQQIVIGQSGMKLYPIQIRYAWPAELDLMARLAGMRLRERWCNWQRDPFVAESAHHISIYELH